jgi:hypothetical protein
MMKVILMLLLSTNIFAANKVDRIILFETEDPNKTTSRKAFRDKEIYLEKESMLRDEGKSYGVMSEYYYTRNDNGRLSFAYHLSHDYEKLSKLQGIDLQIMKKVDSYQDQWWAFRLSRVVGKYNAMADELVASSANPDADSQTIRDDNLQSMTMLGLGLGYRFNILNQFLKSDRVFEQVMAYGNYIFHLDGTNDNRYQGYGVTAEYGIHKRINSSFFAGVKLNYNIASLTRAQKSDEDKIDRSLILKWTGVALELGYFY